MSFKSLWLLLFATTSFLPAQTTRLSFNPTGAAYSSALDRIIFLSASTNQLHIYDPVANVDQAVSLPETPAGLSLTPDGLYAAVALADSVSYVSLQAASVVKTFTNAPIANGSVVAGAGYLYVFSYDPGPVTSINVSSGAVSTSSVAFASNGIFNPALSAIYSGGPTLDRYNVSGATVSNYIMAPYIGEFSTCLPMWLSADNSKIYTGCGTVFNATADAEDMHYTGLLGSLTAIQSIASSSLLNQIAAVPITPATIAAGTTPANDTQVILFDSNYNPVGQFQTNPFTAGSETYAAHGRWVFYNSSSSKMFVVTQADASAGLTASFAIDSISLGDANSCSAQFAAAAASAPAAGGYATAQIMSGEDCVFSAASSVPWITLSSGYYGSGNTALRYLVRPNLTGASRTGSISLGSQTFSVTQDAAGAASSVNPLSFNPVAADYDKALDKIVMVSAAPNELHVYDPVTHADQIVALASTPLSVSVRPDGLFAAVGNHGSLSYVDLSALTVSKVIPIDMDIAGLALAGNGYAYAFPSELVDSVWNSVEIATGTLTPRNVIFMGNEPRLYSSGNYLYVGNTYLGVDKYDISSGPATFVNVPDVASSQGIWLTEDGTRLIAANGEVFTTSPVASQDLLADGYLAAAGSVAWAAQSQTQHQTAVLTNPSDGGNAQLQVYNDSGLQLLGQQAMPSFTAGGTSYSSTGQYLFWNAAETQLFAITQANSASGLLSSFAVDTIAAPASVPACTYSLSPSTVYVEERPGQVATWTVQVTSNCGWRAVASDPSWITISNSNGTTEGNGTVTFFESGYNYGAQRSETIQIGTQAVTVIQPGPACSYSLSGTIAILPLSGGTGTVDVITQSGCPWSAQSNNSGLTVSPQNGVGPGSIQYSAGANLPWSSSISVAGIQLYVSEGTFSSTPLNFVPVTPCRVADTRNAAGPFGGPSIEGNSSRSFTIPASACNIPSNAAAYSLNVAVVPHGPLGYLTSWATGQPQPFVATLNSDGRVKSTAAIVPAGTNGAASFYATDETDLVLDINGYFVSAMSNTGLNYYVLNPCRVADTREANGALGGPFLTAWQERDMPVQQSACSVPSEAQAYSVNLAAVPLAGGLGYATIWPVGQAQPLVASLNAPTGAVTSNAALTPAGSGGDIALVASDNTQAIIDINGYFAPASGAGLHYYTVTPCRVLDTRSGQNAQPFTGTLAVQVVGNCYIPSDASAVVVNATVVPAGPLGYLTMWADGEPQPYVATLNASDGAITSNMAIVPMMDGVIDAFATSPTHLVVDVEGYFAP